MISKTIKTTSGPLKITIPSTRDEITIGMLEALTPPPGESYSPLEQLSILSGIPTGKPEFDKREYDIDVPTLSDIPEMDSLSFFDETLQALSYQIAAFVEVQEIPESIVLDIPHAQRSHGKFLSMFDRRHIGKMVPVITNLGIQPAGAYMEAKQVIKTEFDEWDRIKKEYGDHIEFSPSIQSYIKVLALYFYVPATGEKFTPARANGDFVDVIRKLSITKALPIARYFFLSYPNLSKPKVTPFPGMLRKLKSVQG